MICGSAGRTKRACSISSFHLRNTQTRSQGFWDGLREVCPDSEMVLSLDAQSTLSTRLINWRAMR